jgi:hypothetical protein
MASFKEVLQASTPAVPMQEENKKRYLSAHVCENVNMVDANGIMETLEMRLMEMLEMRPT